MGSKDSHDKKRKARGSDASKPKAKRTKSASGSGAGGEEAKVVVDSQTATGPVLVSCPDFVVPPETPFTLYTAPPLEEEGAAVDDDHEQTLLVGEDETMRYVSNNGDWSTFADEERGMGRVREYDGEYMLGVYDPDEKTVTLRRAPLLSIRRTVRAHADLNSMAVGSNDYAARTQQRRQLGDLFGNRKMKTKASNADRMKVEGSSSAMQRILTQVTSGIDASSKENAQESQASHDEAHAAAIAAGVPTEVLRYIPLPNTAAEHPEEVYSVSSLVPPEVLAAFKIDRISNVENPTAAGKWLPIPAPGQGTYMPQRVYEAAQAYRVSQNHQTEQQLRLSCYAATLWALLFSQRMLNNRRDLTRKLKLDNLPNASVIITHLYLSFTEAQRGTKERVLTTFMKTKLLSYLAALLLHIDAFAVDVGRVSVELEITPKRLADIFSSLGCRSSLAMSATEGRKVSKQVLRLPLKWPRAPSAGRRF